MPGIRIISHSGLPFEDRIQAGKLLARELLEYRGRLAVVLGIPRGGIIVAREIAHELEIDLDIVLSRKLATPGQPELAMGAVSEDGRLFLNQNIISELRLDSRSIAEEKARQMDEIQRRSRMVRQILPRVPLKSRIAILTDDGVATGATMQSALWVIRQEQPEKIVIAIPVASEEAVKLLAVDADEVICLRMPDLFYAVGQFYRHFNPVEDSEVLSVVREEHERQRMKLRG